MRIGLRYKIFGLRPPLAIFLISVIVLTGVGCAIIYSTLRENLSEDGDSIVVKTEIFRFKFPRNWYAYPIWENESVCIVNLVNTESDSILGMIYYKRQEYTRALFKEHNIKDDLSIPLFEINRFYNYLRERGGPENITLYIVENGTIPISGYNAAYAIFFIRNAFESRGTYYNLTGIFISLVINENLFEVVFYTWKDHIWDERYDVFKTKVLSSLVIEHGGE